MTSEPRPCGCSPTSCGARWRRWRPSPRATPSPTTSAGRRLLELAAAAAASIERLARRRGASSLALARLDLSALVRDAVDAAALAGLPVDAEVEARLSGSTATRLGCGRRSTTSSTTRPATRRPDDRRSR